MVGARCMVTAFKYNNLVDYILEFSPFKIRIYCNGYLVGSPKDGIEIMGPGKEPPADHIHRPLTITTPYSADDLWDNDEKCWRIQTIQHSDVLYIFHEKYPIKVLKRYAHNSWILEDLALKNGPYLKMNTTDVAVQAIQKKDGVNVNVYANKPIFKQSDVGRLFRIHLPDVMGKRWQSGGSVKTGDVWYSDKKYYEALDDGTTGDIKPIHQEGIRQDGRVRWKYLHDGTYQGKIIEFISEQLVTIHNDMLLPKGFHMETVYWEFGMLQPAEGYPISGAFFRNRFAFLVNTPFGPNVCFSCAGDYNNFADNELGEATAETAITVPVLNTEFNKGKWICAGDVLFVGTGTSEFYIDVIAPSQAFAADNVKIAQISRVGSKALQPVAIGRHLFFADKYGLSLRDLMYNYYNEGYDQTDISLLGKHLFESGIVALAYQEVPDKILWCVMANGKLTALTFSAEQEVAALSRHDADGKAESIAVASNSLHKTDEVWLSCQKMSGLESQRIIGFLQNGLPLDIPHYVYLTESKNDYCLKEAFYLDYATEYRCINNDKKTVISGLKYLENERVCVFADGEIYPEQMVMNGEVVLPKSANHVLIGRKIISRFIPQYIYLPTDFASGIGQRQRINHVLLMLYLSGGGKVGADKNTLEEIRYDSGELFSGNKELLFNGQTSTVEHAAEILIENDTPLPMNILAIVPTMDAA